MTTLVHPNAQPVVYAHQITFPQAVGSVTSSNWKRAFDALVASVDRDLMRGEPTAVEMTLELIGFEILNPGIVEKEAAIEAEIAAKAKPAPAPVKRTKKPREPLPDIACRICKAKFTPFNRVQVYCSSKCRAKADPSKQLSHARRKRNQEAVK